MYRPERPMRTYAISPDRYMRRTVFSETLSIFAVSRTVRSMGRLIAESCSLTIGSEPFSWSHERGWSPSFLASIPRRDERSEIRRNNPVFPRGEHHSGELATPGQIRDHFRGNAKPFACGGIGEERLVGYPVGH